MRRALGHKAGMRFLEIVSTSQRIMKIYSESSVEEAAHKVLSKFEDQVFSYTDAVSFSVMKQEGIIEAFSFDKHFITAGFKLIP
jgi:predicted nucleic acid-binding protein